MPGTKLRDGESAICAARRLRQHLPALGGSLQCIDYEMEETERKSKFEIRSVYIKTTCCMRHTAGEPSMQTTFGTETYRSQPTRPLTPSTTNIFNRLEGLYATRDDGKQEIYAWLSQQDVEFLQSPAG